VQTRAEKYDGKISANYCSNQSV